VRIGCPRGRLDLVPRGVRLTEEQVLGHRAVEEVGVLGDDRELLPQLFERDLAQVAPAQ
jgi:hypothetical protein